MPKVGSDFFPSDGRYLNVGHLRDAHQLDFQNQNNINDRFAQQLEELRMTVNGNTTDTPVALPALPPPAQDELNDHFAQQLEVLRKTVNGNIEMLKHQQAQIQALQTDKKDMQQQVSELQQQVLELQVEKHKHQYNAKIEALVQRADELEKLTNVLKNRLVEKSFRRY
jgi:predicted RNase H-like nuclease (RuvC/YqgF family)